MRIRRVFAFLIIVFSIAFSGWVLKDAINQRIFGFVGFENEFLVETPPDESGNRQTLGLTDIFVQKIGEELTLTNNGELTALDDGGLAVKVPTSTSVNEWLAEQMEKFSADSLKPEIADGELVVNPDQSEAAILDYLDKMQAILLGNFSDLPPLNYSAGGSPSADDLLRFLDELLPRYDKTIAELRGLPVPQNVLAFHKEEIRLLAGQKEIYKTLRGYRADPLKALITAAANKKISEDFTVLQNNFLEFLENHNISWK